MFYPDNDGSTTRDIRKHSIRLADWCYSIEHKTRTRLSAWVPAHQRLYAPEIVAKKPLDHSTDMYMGAMTMLEMCDKSVPKEITDSIRRWVEKNPKQRPAQTMQYFQEFLGIQKAIYGAPQWHDFNVPGGPAK
jgi:serine/threonine protein kinase